MEKRPLKILRVALDNVAGFPYDFYKMHNAAGDQARLVTMHRNLFNYPEDICLDLPLPRGGFAKKWRNWKKRGVERAQRESAHYFQPRNIAEKFYFDLQDRKRRIPVERAIKAHNLDDFQIIFYDSGIDFYRNSSQAIKWKNEGKRIINCYYGSDLRVRGIIREMEEIADINITAEYDHLHLKPDLEFIFYPYDPSELPAKKEKKDDVFRIAHSPTNRLYRGTDTILEVIEKLKRERDFEFHLLENMPRQEVLEIKSCCDLGIECIGGYLGATGYGKSGLEMLALGAPVVTSMTGEYRKWLPENPFIVANTPDELFESLREQIDNPELTSQKGIESKAWVEKYHGFENVNRMLYDLYGKYGIL